jgi:ubiquinone/menaquinone biosynthesis C-methylase UbiE
MASHVLTTFAQRPPRPTNDRLAKQWSEEVYPLFGARFDELVLRHLEALPPKCQVLEQGCGAGDVTAELLRRIDGDGRIVALDASAGLIDRARLRLAEEHAGRRVFFRQQAPSAPLPFPEDSYDLVLSNLALTAAADEAAQAAMLKDAARVLKPGGRLILTTPLAGTWAEPLDLLREALTRLDRATALAALDAYRACQPRGEAVARAIEAAGLVDLKEELTQWELLFRSGREFFYAPVIEHLELPRWKEIAATGGDMHPVFFAMKEAVDTYYAGRAFPVGVFGACFVARKP